ncbi:Mini-ribonuclease 3 [Moorella sp. Hama-1]|uniref:Mini-ribonuclease 3 n=1 Tax=Moorella sp. Hama-1 TaxID=2138101 RepID=UPI000D6573CD|nr:ribonuclease III domain-containing protein [Moorella sp. Hama-1]MDN5362150.1 mini-ribonuclease [Moorella sp. (in: firmicutes)]BCV23168.1 mini-ribonuclease 3 [Moorella sp. Hama-1]
MDPAADLSPLVLAYVGDAVYELLVRTYLVRRGPARPEQLHREAMKYVRATAQARLVPALEEYLTPAERDVLRRGRNARPGHLPRTAAPAEYHSSTALESLLGYLYLQGNETRLAEIASLLFTLAGKEEKTNHAN